MGGIDLDKFSDKLLNREREVKEYLLSASPIGTMDSALSDMLKGVNITTRTPPGKNRNRFKKVFFTRPMLNLSMYNLMMNRKLAKLMNKDIASMERYILTALDPRQEYGEELFGTHYDSEVTARYKGPKRALLIDKYQPFIPVLSNALMTSSGYLDTVLDTFTSGPGMRKEVWGWTNSINRIYTAWDMDTTFMNTIGEPVFGLLDIWVEYQSLVSEGICMPWFDFLLGRRIDYTTGIFTMVLAEDNRSINHMAKTIGHPITNPNGKFYDYNREANVADEVGDINMRWRCYGVEYDDPIILMDFNKHVASFNPKLRGYVSGLESYKEHNDYVEVPPHLYTIFSTVSIPFVDIRYKKLEWLVSKSDIEQIEQTIDKI